jgi:uncharacterized protein
MNRDAAYWIRRLELLPHPEGGYYRQTYRSDLLLPKSVLPEEFSGTRAASTAIYFLLDENSFSAFHRLRSDEIWHFYFGRPLIVHIIDANGRYSEIRLGSDPEAGEVFQATVKAGCWFASQLAVRAEALLHPQSKRQVKPARQNESADEKASPEPFCLVGCTVAPGFDFEDFDLGKRDELVQLYPQHQALIESLTRM